MFQPNHLFLISYNYVYVIMYYTFFRIIKQPSVSLNINFSTIRYSLSPSLHFYHTSYLFLCPILSKMFSLQIAFNLLHQSERLLSSPKRWICNHSGKIFNRNERALNNLLLWILENEIVKHKILIFVFF